MNDLIQVLVAIFIALGTVAGIVKWALASYFEKVHEIEKMKESYVDFELKTLNKFTIEIKNEVNNITTKIKDFELHLFRLNHRFDTFDKTSAKVIADQIQILDQLKNRPKVLEDYDLMEIKKDLYILKKKSHVG